MKVWAIENSRSAKVILDAPPDAFDACVEAMTERLRGATTSYPVTASAEEIPAARYPDPAFAEDREVVVGCRLDVEFVLDATGWDRDDVAHVAEELEATPCVLFGEVELRPMVTTRLESHGYRSRRRQFALLRISEAWDDENIDNTVASWVGMAP